MELKPRRAASGAKPPTVLIVPFMELKLRISAARSEILIGLNRTFYGIETKRKLAGDHYTNVLIVPFMELKRERELRQMEHAFYVLIVPFMELKRT